MKRPSVDIFDSATLLALLAALIYFAPAFQGPPPTTYPTGEYTGP